MLNYLWEVAKGISWSSAASIVFGAAIGATVSYILQRNSFAEAQRQKEKDRFELRKAHAYSLFFKMLRIYSNLAILQKSIKQTPKKTTADEGKLAGPWQNTLPLANLPDRVKFTSDEMALLLSLNTLLFNDLGPLDDVHNGVIDVFEMYRAKRASVMELFSAEMDGNLGTTTFTKEQHDRLAPRVAELNMLIEAMAERTEGDSKEAWSLLKRIHKLFVKEFDFHPKLQLKEPATA